MVRRVSRFVLRDEEREDRGQEHEDKRLDEADQQFQKIKRNWDQPRERWHDVAHRFQHGFASVNVAEESEAKRDRPEQDGNDLQPTDDEKDHDHQQLQNAGGLALGTEDVHDDPADAVGLDRPDNPTDKKDRGHRERQIKVRIGAAEQRPVDMESAGSWVGVTPADGPDAGKKAKPIQAENENEDSREEPEGLLDQLSADHV